MSQGKRSTRPSKKPAAARSPEELAPPGKLVQAATKKEWEDYVEKFDYPISDADTEFYTEFGHAMSSWQLAETVLVDIMGHIFFENPDEELVGTIYYSNNSFPARLNLITSGLNCLFRKNHTICKEWVEYRQEIGRLWTDRGRLSHPHIWTEVRWDRVPPDRQRLSHAGDHFIERPPLHPKERRPELRLGVGKLKRHGQAVWKLGLRLVRFQDALRLALPSPRRSLQQRAPRRSRTTSRRNDPDKLPQVLVHLLEPWSHTLDSET